MSLSWLRVGAMWGSVAACAASGGDPGAVGDPAPVQVLDAAFVRFEGRRMPVEGFLLEMRERARRAGRDPERLPWVQVSLDPAARPLPPGYMTRLRAELYKSGIRFVDLGR